jgi:hypothetical protein
MAFATTSEHAHHIAAFVGLCQEVLFPIMSNSRPWHKPPDENVGLRPNAPRRWHSRASFGCYFRQELLLAMHLQLQLRQTLFLSCLMLSYNHVWPISFAITPSPRAFRLQEPRIQKGTFAPCSIILHSSKFHSVLDDPNLHRCSQAVDDVRGGVPAITHAKTFAQSTSSMVDWSPPWSMADSS